MCYVQTLVVLTDDSREAQAQLSGCGAAAEQFVASVLQNDQGTLSL